MKTAPQWAGIDLVKIAADLRRRAGQTRPAFSTVRIIETCFPGTLVTGGRLKPGVAEMVSRRPEGPVIIYARELPGPEQRIAIAHGLAHLLFDDESAAARAGCRGLPANEERADLFAAELLAPLDELAVHVCRYPSADPEDNELYLDQVDQLASQFALPAHIIDLRIRLLVPSYESGQQ